MARATAFTGSRSAPTATGLAAASADGIVRVWEAGSLIDLPPARCYLDWDVRRTGIGVPNPWARSVNKHGIATSDRRGVDSPVEATSRRQTVVSYSLDREGTSDSDDENPKLG